MIIAVSCSVLANTGVSKADSRPLIRRGLGVIALCQAFLPTAERCGLIAEIDHWVIGEATKIAAHGTPVGVNLSAASAGNPGVLDLIERELRSHSADPANLVFEITETAVMQNMDRATRFAERLVELGCRFALDDFGTGFASFTYLKRLPVQYLKIDIEFVRDVARSQRDMFVVRAIVALATDFGQQTIAEGVENQYTADVLRDLGVTFAQGFLYGRPDTITDQHLPNAHALHAHQASTSPERDETVSQRQLLLGG